MEVRRRALGVGAKIRLDREALAVRAKWRQPRRIFVNSMSDLFHDAVPAPFVAEAWEVMESTPQHTYQILTKRPERMAAAKSKKLPNVWLGTSVESSDYLDRIDALRKVNAAIRFISFEPLLESVASADLSGIQWAIVGGESGPRSVIAV
jgi:protein gp37